MRIYNKEIYQEILDTKAIASIGVLTKEKGYIVKTIWQSDWEQHANKKPILSKF